MLRKFLIFALSAALLAACAPQATPTVNPLDVQATALSAANTMVALTQQAIPTATPLPPTETPSPTPEPTFTPAIPLETATLPPTPTQAVVSDPNSCLKPLDMGEAGPTKRVRVENQTNGGTFNLSLTLWKPNDFGQCGALSYTIGKGDVPIIEIPNGSWYAYAWITLKNGKQSTAEGSFYFGPSKTSDLNRLIVKPDIIVLVGP